MSDDSAESVSSNCPYETNVHYCPTCDSDFDSKHFEFVCMVPERGNLARFKCLKCGKSFEELPPDPSPQDFMRPAE